MFSYNIQITDLDASHWEDKDLDFQKWVGWWFLLFLSLFLGWEEKGSCQGKGSVECVFFFFLLRLIFSALDWPCITVPLGSTREVYPFLLSAQCSPCVWFKDTAETRGLIGLGTVLVRISWKPFLCSSQSIFSLFWLALSHETPPTFFLAYFSGLADAHNFPLVHFLSSCSVSLLFPFGIWLHLPSMLPAWLGLIPLNLLLNMHANMLLTYSGRILALIFMSQHYLVFSIYAIWWQWQPALEALVYEYIGQLYQEDQKWSKKLKLWLLLRLIQLWKSPTPHFLLIAAVLYSQPINLHVILFCIYSVIIVGR